MKNKKEYFWALIGKFIPQSIYLITTMILARYLSPDDFGMVGVLAIFFTVSSVLMDSGLGGSLIKENEIKRIDCSTIFVFNLAVSHILYLFLFVLSDNIEDYFAKDGLSKVVKLSSLVFVINSWGLVPKSLLQKELKFRIISNIGIISVIIAALGSVILGINGYGVYALVGYQLINALVQVVLLLYKANFFLSFKFSRTSFKKLIPFGLYTTLTHSIDTVYENIITSLFGKYFNLQQAGLLYQAKRLEEVPSHSLIVTINSVAFPVLTKLKDSPDDFIKEAKNIFILIISLITPLLLTISLFSKPIIILLYGDKWIEASPYLSILMFAGIFILAENVNRNFIKSLGQVSQLFKYTLIKRIVGISLIVLVILISPKYVLYAYIVSSFIGYIVNNYVYCHLMTLSSVTNFCILFKIFVPNAGYYIVMLLVMYYVDNLIMQVLISLFLLLLYVMVLSKYMGWNLNSLFKLRVNYDCKRT